MTCAVYQQTPIEQRLAVAEAAARAAGAYLRQQFHAARCVNEELPHDIKLQLDKDTQQLIEQHLLTAFPQDSVLGEEGCSGLSGAEYEWVVDPLDGTVNYYYGIPLFCVSIALRKGEAVLLGCVYDPMQDECFTAMAGKPACLNGEQIKVSARSRMAEAVVFVGHGTHDGSGAKGVRRFAHISSQVRKVRILGSAALSICYIAVARMDAYIENRINVWDFAAARVILESAGGCLEYTPSAADSVSGAVVAWNGALPIHSALQMPD